MDQLGFHLESSAAPPPGPTGTPPGRRVTGLAEIRSETPPEELCSLTTCGDPATRWVVYDHAAAFTAYCTKHAPPSPWWTPPPGEKTT